MSNNNRDLNRMSVTGGANRRSRRPTIINNNLESLIMEDYMGETMSAAGGTGPTGSSAKLDNFKSVIIVEETKEDFKYNSDGSDADDPFTQANKAYADKKLFQSVLIQPSATLSSNIFTFSDIFIAKDTTMKVSREELPSFSRTSDSRMTTIVQAPTNLGKETVQINSGI